METADVIRNLCKEKGISVTDLEKSLGFSNGSLTKKGINLRSDRLLAVARFFDVSMEYLMGVVDKDENILRPITTSEYNLITNESYKYSFNSIFNSLGYNVSFKNDHYILETSQDEFGEYKRHIYVEPDELDRLNNNLNDYILYQLDKFFSEHREKKSGTMAS